MLLLMCRQDSERSLELVWETPDHYTFQGHSETGLRLLNYKKKQIPDTVSLSKLTTKVKRWL